VIKKQQGRDKLKVNKKWRFSLSFDLSHRLKFLEVLILKPFYMLLISLLLTAGCRLNDNQIHGSFNSTNGPGVSFAALSPSTSVGNSSTTFNF
jgi:hypothetical protein